MASHAADFWRTHLCAPDGRHIHFVEAALCDPAGLVRAGHDLGMAIFHVDARDVGGKADFMTEIATAARFPAYFGWNWDAVSDLLRDLSWAPASGYVLLISCGDGLLRMGTRDFVAFVHVVEKVIRDWRDERGEYDERFGPIPFHLVLCGSKVLSDELVKASTEPVCDHSF